MESLISTVEQRPHTTVVSSNATTEKKKTLVVNDHCVGGFAVSQRNLNAT